MILKSKQKNALLDLIIYNNTELILLVTKTLSISDHKVMTFKVS